MKRASAYLRGNRIFIWPDARTTAGVWIATLPVLASSPDHPEEVGRSLLNCLSASKDGVPHPVEWAGSFKPFLSTVGVRSWKSFVAGTKHVGIELDKDSVTFEPYRNGGAKEGFTPLPDKARSVPKASPDLGAELLGAFAEAE